MEENKKSDLPEIKTSLPGPKSKILIEKYIEQIGGEGRPSRTADKGYGCINEDMDGNKFLVFSQIANVTGYSTPEIINAATDQLKKRIIRGIAPPLVDFTEVLLGKLPVELSRGRVNYVVSGTESVGLSILIAREYTKRPLILSYHGSHHGYLGSTFQVSGDPRIKRSWRAKVSDVVYIPYPTCYRCPFKTQYQDCDLLCLRYIEEVLETVALPEHVAGLIIEPILVNGGLYIPPDEYMKGVMDICQKNEILLIADEVYTGVGKSGKFLVMDHWDITPDLLCLGKAIGGGFPLAVVVTRREITDIARGGVRFNGTFSGNLVACAAGIATIKYVEKNHLIENARKMGEYIIKSFRDMSKRKSMIGDVRGKGLLIGIELVTDKVTKEPASEDASKVVKAARENGLLIGSVGRDRNVLLLGPPLTISLEQTQMAIGILDRLIN